MREMDAYPDMPQPTDVVLDYPSPIAIWLAQEVLARGDTLRRSLFFQLSQRAAGIELMSGEPTLTIDNLSLAQKTVALGRAAVGGLILAVALPVTLPRLVMLRKRESELKYQVIVERIASPEDPLKLAGSVLNAHHLFEENRQPNTQTDQI